MFRIVINRKGILVELQWQLIIIAIEAIRQTLRALLPLVAALSALIAALAALLGSEGVTQLLRTLGL